MKNEWIVIEVVVPGQLVEIVSAVLADFGAGGTVIEERQLDTFSIPDEDLEPDQDYHLKAYFAAAEPSLSREIKSALAALPVLSGQQLSVSDPAIVKMEDWAENWKQNFSALQIGSRLVIHPSWEDYQAKAGEAVIEIDPGMAFGTGSHGTTLLCLEMIAELFDAAEAPADMLDVGTGSGILALGAAALGCQRILANDIDPLACKVARENVAKNGFAEQIEITPQPLEELAGEFDLVVANILAEENVRLKDALLQHTRPGGWLVLSGILREKEALVREGFAGLPLTDFPTRVQDDWICLLYRRQQL